MAFGPFLLVLSATLTTRLTFVRIGLGLLGLVLTNLGFFLVVSAAGRGIERGNEVRPKN